jgi:hypothetical protein
MRLVPSEVRLATHKWATGEPLREIHDLLKVGKGSSEVEAAIAEAYVRGQSEVIPHLERLSDENAELRAASGTPRKLSSASEIGQLRKHFQSVRRLHPEWNDTRVAKHIAGAFDSRPDYRTVMRRLIELGLVRTGPSFTIPFRPTTPLNAWIIGRS